MKFFRKVHLWLSVPFGIIVTLVCFSGAMLIFEPEITKGCEERCVLCVFSRRATDSYG